MKNLKQKVDRLKRPSTQIKLALIFIGLFTTLRVGQVLVVVNWQRLMKPFEYTVSALTIPKAEAELPMKEWIKREVENAGLDWEEASKIIECESKGNPDAHKVNWDSMKGVDRGLWQISSLYHPEISNKCSYDYKCSTKEAIKIRKEWGSWGAWACADIVL